MRRMAAVSGHDHDELDEPVSDEFEELLAAMQSCHTPEQFEQYARRIPELISAVRQASKERDANLQKAREQQRRALRAEAVALVLRGALRQA